jgi:hypothetical protein
MMEYLEIAGVAGVGPYPLLYLCRPNINKATIDMRYKQVWALFGRKATTWKDKICKRQWGRLAYTLSFERRCSAARWQSWTPLFITGAPAAMTVGYRYRAIDDRSPIGRSK